MEFRSGEKKREIRDRKTGAVRFRGDSG